MHPVGVVVRAGMAASIGQGNGAILGKFCRQMAASSRRVRLVRLVRRDF